MSRITKIEIQKNNKNKVNIFVDNNFFIGCYVDIVYKFNLKLDMEIDEKKLKKLFYEQEYESCKQKALNSISRAEKSEKKMREKLEKDYNEQTVDRVIEFLKKYSFIDDERYAKRIVVNDQNFKRNGKNKIRQNLYQKGFSREEIEKSLSYLDEEKEIENAIYIAQKKLNKIKEKDVRIKKNKLYQHLSYKGFSYVVISKAVENVLSEKDSF